MQIGPSKKKSFYEKNNCFSKKRKSISKRNLQFLFMFWEAKGAILIFINFDYLEGLLTGFDGFSLVPEP